MSKFPEFGAKCLNLRCFTRLQLALKLTKRLQSKMLRKILYLVIPPSSEVPKKTSLTSNGRFWHFLG